MASMNFRLPAARNDCAATRRMPQRRVMNAEDAARIALRRLGAAAAGGSTDEDDAEQAYAGSGWFDSTWELSQGLEICEGPPVDLPLDGWLQIYLASELTVSAAASAA